MIALSPSGMFAVTLARSLVGSAVLLRSPDSLLTDTPHIELAIPRHQGYKPSPTGRTEKSGTQAQAPGGAVTPARLTEPAQALDQHRIVGERLG